jgi:hypothetical protein
VVPLFVLQDQLHDQADDRVADLRKALVLDESARLATDVLPIVRSNSSILLSSG